MRRFDFKRLNEFPLALQCVLIALVCSVVFYLGYLWDFTSLNKKLADNQHQEQDLKVQLQAQLNMEGNLDAENSKLPVVQQAIQEWRGKLIKETELPDLLNEILKVGTANNLQFDVFTPGKEVKEGPYFKIPIKTVVQGTYNQIAEFISQVANMSWVVAINDFVIEKNNPTAAKDATTSSDTLKAELTLDAYHLDET